jgi:polyisoprenoid-binding protein YceI
VGVLSFIAIIGGTGEPSATISAPTLSLSDQPTQSFDGEALATQVALLESENAELSTEVAQLNGQVESLSLLATQNVPAVAENATPTNTRFPTVTRAPTRLPTITPTFTASAQPNQKLFRIVSEESEARYIVDELRPFIQGLVGRTNQVAGDIIVDFDNPQNSRVGIIRINLRTLRTDDPVRDGTVRGDVLLSALPEYEFTDFTPTSITGLPESIQVGDTVTFQITGDLPLRGITHAVTFETTVTVVSETEIQGLARTTVLRADYNLLQEGLGMHGVSDEVILEIEFIAREVVE